LVGEDGDARGRVRTRGEVGHHLVPSLARELAIDEGVKVVFAHIKVAHSGFLLGASEQPSMTADPGRPLQPAQPEFLSIGPVSLARH